MKLSDDLFEDIRRTLGLADVRSWDATRGRRVGRLAASAEVVIVPFGRAGARGRRVTLVDVSKRGVSILDDRTWAPGERFIIRLERRPGHVIPFVCEARNTKLVGGQFRVGAEFVDEAIVADDESPAPQAERRARRQRFRDRAPARLHTYHHQAPGPILEAEVADLSDVGVGLICAGELAVGQTLIVRLCPPGGRTITRMCVVANCRELDSGDFRVGATFVQTPRSFADPGRPKRGLQLLLGWFRDKD